VINSGNKIFYQTKKLRKLSKQIESGNWRMKKKTQLMAILLVVIMFAVAGQYNQKEIIFPEISALALGAWVMERSPWRSSNFNFWLSPTLAALTGIIIMRSFPYSPFFMIAGAFTIVALQMKVLRSDVLPSLSAAILPIITRADSWYYPLSVCLLTGTIAMGRHISAYYCHGESSINTKNLSGSEESGNYGAMNALVHWSKLLIGISIVSAIALESHRVFMVAPPLIVAFAELSKPNGSLRKQSFKIMILLSFAAFIGVFWLEIICHVLQWPIWVFACLSLTSVFLFYHYLRLPFPPAAAIALLPAIIPSESLWSYPLHVSLGSAAFIAISMLWFRGNVYSFRTFPAE
jgi:hypothetical protein